MVESETCSGYPASGTNVGATATVGIPTPGCASYSGGDVWYSFVVPTNGTVTVDLQVGGITDSGMAFYSSSDNTCSGSFTLIECDDDDSANGAHVIYNKIWFDTRKHYFRACLGIRKQFIWYI
ncbi:MAG: hypothetical protein IPP49_14720 [Saprospiraceae bacterium]|nr:hypothetical protein [Saprospiraceae bacterium]